MDKKNENIVNELFAVATEDNYLEQIQNKIKEIVEKDNYQRHVGLIIAASAVNSEGDCSMSSTGIGDEDAMFASICTAFLTTFHKYVEKNQIDSEAENLEITSDWIDKLADFILMSEFGKTANDIFGQQPTT